MEVEQDLEQDLKLLEKLNQDKEWLVEYFNTQLKEIVEYGEQHD